MDKIVSAAEANRKFSEVLREVRAGATFVVTSHGKAVAKIVPLQEATSAMLKAHKALFARLDTQPAMNKGRWKREELYENGP